MRRLRRWYGRIHNRILLFMLLVSLLPIALLGAFSFSFSYSNLLDSYIQQGEISISIVRANLNAMARSMESAARQMLVSNSILNLLRRGDRGSGRADIDTLSRRNIDAELKKILEGMDFSATVVLVNEAGPVYSYSNQAPRLTDPHFGDISAYASQKGSWYQETVQACGKERYYLKNVLHNAQSDQYATLTKLLRSPSTLEHYGILVMIISIDEIRALVPAALNKKGISHVVMSEEQRVVIGEAFDDEALALDSRERGTISVQNPRTGWIVAHVINRKLLLRENAEILIFTLVVAAAMLAASVFLSLYASRSISRQLIMLGEAISEMERTGGITQRNFGEDEVGIIGRHFLSMAQANQQLQQKLIKLSIMEKEAEFRALQTQINPHFLYNTLSSIYWLCKLRQADRAAEVAVLLANNFRYILSRSGDEVKVEEEINNIMGYIAIQNIRYDGQIQAQYDIDPEVRNKKIPKLLLQPMVENAIFHGLEAKLGAWMIQIHAKTIDGIMRFDVVDNGVGIDMENFTHGFGIHNVSERIRLRYGDKGSFTMSSSPGGGSRVSISIPVKER